METQVEIFMNRFPTNTQKVDSAIELLSNGINDEILRNLGLSLTFTELKRKLEECKSIFEIKKVQITENGQPRTASQAIVSREKLLGKNK